MQLKTYTCHIPVDKCIASLASAAPVFAVQVFASSPSPVPAVAAEQPVSDTRAVPKHMTNFRYFASTSCIISPYS